MIRAIVAIAVTTILISPVMSLAQSTGGATAGSGSVAGSPGVATARGTNSVGTAQSSGANTAPGMTTGAAGALGTVTAPTPKAGGDTAINQENKTIDRRLNSICRGC